MNIVVVDDRPLQLRALVSAIQQVEPDAQIMPFSSAEELLAWVEGQHIDVAFLDIDLPVMGGIELAQRLKAERPRINIIFATGYAEFLRDALELHCSGYILKPVTPEKVRRELADLRHPVRQHPWRVPGKPVLRCFGNFEVFGPDGTQLSFERAKAKELLAYLVERQGREITREEAYRALWEKETYDRPAQKQLDVILRSLRETLTEYGIGEIFSMRRGGISVIPGTFSCDMYRFLLGDASAVGAYRGEYMTAYSWASLQEAFLERKVENPKQRMNNEE